MNISASPKTNGKERAKPKNAVQIKRFNPSFAA
jgi:hypothetical protein